MKTWWLAVVLTLVLAGVAAAEEQPKETTPPVSRPGGLGRTTVPGVRGKAPIIGQVSIGEKAPDFVLDASDGGQTQLSRTRGQWVLLAFGDRYHDLATLDTLDAHARPMGARVIAVCHEKQQTLTTLATKEKVRMLMLADPTGEVSSEFGVFDWGANRTEPGFYVIDREGVVQLVIIGRLFPNDQMLAVLQFATGSTN